MTVPMLDELIQLAAAHGGREVVVAWLEILPFGDRKRVFVEVLERPCCLGVHRKPPVAALPDVVPTLCSYTFCCIYTSHSNAS